MIEPSNSSYASPAFLVPKPGGRHRIVIDYRKLNANIEVDSVPLPNLHSAFDWFSGPRYFTVIDLNAAYHQIPLAKESRPYTAFCVPWNLYQYTRVPVLGDISSGRAWIGILRLALRIVVSVA